MLSNQNCDSYCGCLEIGTAVSTMDKKYSIYYGELWLISEAGSAKVPFFRQKVKNGWKRRNFSYFAWVEEALPDVG